MSPIPEERLVVLKAEFARLQKRQFLAFVLLIAAGVAAAWSSARGSLLGMPYTVWFVAFLLLLVWDRVYVFRKWRCPSCGHPFTSKFLGIEYPRGLLVRSCRNCGVRLV